MTHDELLATINSRNYRESRTLQTPYFALTAVIELHKPQTVPYGDYCDHCVSALYPCKTIKLIERELQ